MRKLGTSSGRRALHLSQSSFVGGASATTSSLRIALEQAAGRAVRAIEERDFTIDIKDMQSMLQSKWSLLRTRVAVLSPNVRFVSLALARLALAR